MHALSMSDPVEALILDLLEWIGPKARPYSEVLEAWRTSCPRLPVWEEANGRGFLTHEHRAGVWVFVSVSSRGHAFLRERRPVADLLELQGSVVAAAHD